jgi:hypothetical protein
MTVPNPGWETSETGWLGIGTTEVTFTAQTTGDDALRRLLAGPELFAQTHAVQVDYRIPVKLPWWRRVWLWVRRKPHPTNPARLILPNATVTTTEPES